MQYGKRHSQLWLFSVQLVARNRKPSMCGIYLCFLAAFLGSRLTDFHLGEVVVDNSAFWFSELFHDSHEAHNWKMCLLCWVDTLLILSFPNTFKIKLNQLWFYNWFYKFICYHLVCLLLTKWPFVVYLHEFFCSLCTHACFAPYKLSVLSVHNFTKLQHLKWSTDHIETKWSAQCH